MVARGDLGLKPPEEVPILQKRLLIKVESMANQVVVAIKACSMVNAF